jgi:GNAT superfamily N-acetyltransferase
VLNITDLYVKHEYRNQSYGTKLLKHAIQLAKECNCESITLDDCSDRFKSPHNIYVKLGFKYIDPNFPEMILIIRNT